MKSIIVPTDFSKHSLLAVDYAAAFAQELGLEMHLLHAMHVPIVDVNSPITLAEVLMENERKTAKEKLDNLASKIKKEFTVNVKIDFDFGLAADYIIDTAEGLNADLIIMGTSGASGFIDGLLGSVTTAVIKRGKKPVLAVPKNAKYQKISVTALANDYKESLEKELNFVYQVTKKFGSRLDIISVEPSKEKYSKIIVSNEGKIREVSIWAPTIYIGIKTYLEEESVNLLVLKQHDRNFFQDLIHKSTTKEILRSSTIPLLIF